MNINISCKSPILQKTLSLYLKDFIVDYDDCDFVISDEIDENHSKPICLVNFNEDSDITRPFYKDSLFRDLDVFNKNLSEIPHINTNQFESILDINEIELLKKSLSSINKEHNSKNPDKLKAEINAVVQDFANRLYDIIKKAQ